MAVVKMRDVAAHAGVSVSTVSKILSGSVASSQIPARTIERVRHSALLLGYIPNVVHAICVLSAHAKSGSCWVRRLIRQQRL